MTRALVCLSVESSMIRIFGRVAHLCLSSRTRYSSMRKPPSGVSRNLLRKCISGCEIAVAVYEDAADNEHRAVRRRYARRAARHLSLPAGTGDEVVARMRAGGARADIAEIDVKRASELHTVVAPGEVRHMQELRSFVRSNQPTVRRVSWFTPTVLSFELPDGSDV